MTAVVSLVNVSPPNDEDKSQFVFFKATVSM